MRNLHRRSSHPSSQVSRRRRIAWGHRTSLAPGVGFAGVGLSAFTYTYVYIYIQKYVNIYIYIHIYIYLYIYGVQSNDPQNGPEL